MVQDMPLEEFLAIVQKGGYSTEEAREYYQRGAFKNIAYLGDEGFTYVHDD